MFFCKSHVWIDVNFLWSKLNNWSLFQNLICAPLHKNLIRLSISRKWPLLIHLVFLERKFKSRRFCFLSWETCSIGRRDGWSLKYTQKEGWGQQWWVHTWWHVSLMIYCSQPIEKLHLRSPWTTILTSWPGMWIGMNDDNLHVIMQHFAQVARMSLSHFWGRNDETQSKVNLNASSFLT